MPAPRRPSAARRSSATRHVAFLLLSGLACAGAMPARSHAQAQPVAVSAEVAPYAAFVAEAARRFGIPERWIWAVMRIESRGRVRAVSSKGAMGLMQIMPDTWIELRARYRLGVDPYDPRDNILAGAAYLREMHDRYGAPGFLAAYNAGPARYDDYLSSGRPLPAETIGYVAVLAPLVGSDPLPGDVATAVDPLAWMRSPLFVARADGGGSADRVQDGRRSEADRAAGSEHVDSPTRPSNDEIFVARSSLGERP